ncbi:MAG: bifunctional indole-3-glycerol phosphate synthase/phosphoribosylanthranilate isomerase [Spirochaetia bacterium]
MRETGKNILEEIVASRQKNKTALQSRSNRERVLGNRITVPFGRQPFVICEIKRASPSKGDFAAGIDPVVQAGIYKDAGIQNVSVLTEPDYFKGDLRFITRIKERYPELSLLRKDFLLDTEDIEDSYRSGADAVLLIASILSDRTIQEMYTRTKELGMRALVEVHDKTDIDKVRRFKPDLVGINSRNLKNFSIDLLHPLRVKKFLTWNPAIILESGIKGAYGGRFAVSENFSGVLVGESVMRNPGLIPKIISGLNGSAENDFWTKLTGKMKIREIPLVKVCGLTNRADVSAAEDFGADLLGFIVAPSPRKAGGAFIRSLPQTRGLKAAVTVCRDGKPEAEAVELLRQGYVDCLQIHGDLKDDLTGIYPYYSSVQVRSPSDTQIPPDYEPPRILLDTFAADKAGGTGKRIPEKFLTGVSGKPLWIAGGINHANVDEIIRNYKPELIDVSSGLELEPGKKDMIKMKKFFKEIRRSR